MIKRSDEQIRLCDYVCETFDRLPSETEWKPRDKSYYTEDQMLERFRRLKALIERENRTNFEIDEKEKTIYKKGVLGSNLEQWKKLDTPYELHYFSLYI